MPLPPEYVDIQDDLKVVKGLLGDELTKTLGDAEYNIEVDEKGVFAINTTRPGQLTQTNEKALKAAEEYLNNRYSGSGKGAQALPWMEMDAKQAAAEISTGLGMMVKTRNEDLSQDGYQFMAVPKAKVDKPAAPVAAVAPTSLNTRLTTNLLEGS